MMKILVVNALTVGRFIMSLFFGCFILVNPDRLVPMFVLFTLVCVSDFLDGRIARRYGAETRIGAVLDVAADLFFMVVSYTVLIMRGSVPFWMIAVIILKFHEFWLTSFLTARTGRNPKSVFLFDKLGRKVALLFYILPMFTLLVEHYFSGVLLNLLLYGYIFAVTVMACISSTQRFLVCYQGLSNKTMAS